MSKELDYMNLDFKIIFHILIKNKYTLLLSVVISVFLSILIAIFSPNVYKSKTILTPVVTDSSISAQLGNFSTLSSIAGIPLPGDSSNKSTEALERIISYDFFVNEFLPYIKLENLVAIKSWEMNSNTIKYNAKIYNHNNQSWVRDASPPFSSKPSNQEAFEIYSEIINVTESKGSPFITISIESYSPYLAKNWLDLIIKRIDSHMRELDKISATKSIAFLNSTISSTNLAEIKDVLSDLLAQQTQTLMLTESLSDYVFKTISSPVVAEKKSRPNRAMICILGAVIGVIFGILLSIYSHSRDPLTRPQSNS